MAKIKYLNQEKLNKVCKQLWELQGSLKGLGALFQRQNNETYMSPEELFGIGQLLQKIANELSEQEDILRCGFDNTVFEEDD